MSRKVIKYSYLFKDTVIYLIELYKIIVFRSVKIL